MCTWSIGECGGRAVGLYTQGHLQENSQGAARGTRISCEEDLGCWCVYGSWLRARAGSPAALDHIAGADADRVTRDALTGGSAARPSVRVALHRMSTSRAERLHLEHGGEPGQARGAARRKCLKCVPAVPPAMIWRPGWHTTGRCVSGSPRGGQGHPWPAGVEQGHPRTAVQKKTGSPLAGRSRTGSPAAARCMAGSPLAGRPGKRQGRPRPFSPILTNSPESDKSPNSGKQACLYFATSAAARPEFLPPAHTQF